MSTATAVKIPPGEQEDALGGEDRSEIGQRAWRGLLRAHACLSKRLDAALEHTHGLPLSSYEALHHLQGSSGGRMRMCDLAEQAGLSRSGLTRLVDRLEREQLLERCSCEQDARGSFACMTSAGQERLQEARGTYLAVVKEHFFSRFSEEELGLLADMWERIAPCNGAD
jgi:DNA-binding MarR family transcriptional regulator